MSQVLDQTDCQAPAFPERELAEPQVSGRLFHGVKRCLDVVIAVSALVMTGPVVALAALAVKLGSTGPVFYRAKRAGLHGQPFFMLKLRTMRVGGDSADRKITAEDDDRVTAVGRLLRKLKIDELPQFWNVLRGDMAIVGPRPEDWDIVQQHYTPTQRRSLEARPGIASPVDVEWYPDLTYHDPAPLGRHLPVQAAEAIRYVERQSLRLDLGVIVRLIFCVLVRSWLPPRKKPLP
jgi:lipopolysaccharide/colanic/teichoic acid biosynthesis glycosyltransferase